MRGFLRWRKREAFLELAKRKIYGESKQAYMKGKRHEAHLGVSANKEFTL